MSKALKKLIINLLLLSFVLSTPALAAQNLVIKGSTTVLPIAQAAAEAYMKKYSDINISISGGGSGDGIKALIDKSTDIANSSRDIKSEELSLAKVRAVNPVMHRVAIDAIAPIVHPSNPVGNLTVEQLSLMYQGKITNWKEVGGRDKKIIVISRDTSSGTYEVWEEKILNKAKVTPRAQMQASNGAIVQAISKNPYAIGYIGIGYMNRTVKTIKVNGIEATEQTAVSGKYPVSRYLYMFTDGQPKGSAADFIKFILSSEGQKIVKKEGFVPMK